MRLLLDSHVLIWHKNEDPRLPERISQLLENPDHDLFVSIAVPWEMAIKESLQKLDLQGGFRALYEEWIDSGMADLLPIQLPHLITLASLPLIHRDPFDRLLIAQAIRENLTLVSGDPNIRQYPKVEVIW